MCYEVVLMDAAMWWVFQVLLMAEGPKPREGRVWVSRLDRACDWNMAHIHAVCNVLNTTSVVQTVQACWGSLIQC
jgi:hypothetical protein